ncbi:MAG: HAD-IA family hydrolase, partial [Sphingomonas sp.]
ITNFSGEFWPPFAATRPDVFGRFRDIVVSGDEKLIKPDPAIFALALQRFGLVPGEAVFIDDVPANAEAATRAGIQGIRFTDAEALRVELVKLGLLF